jgi:hypothetical protein
MDTVFGSIVTLGIGVIVIAAIYQLGKSSNPIVPTAGTAYNNTLSALFK